MTKTLGALLVVLTALACAQAQSHTGAEARLKWPSVEQHWRARSIPPWIICSRSEGRSGSRVNKSRAATDSLAPSAAARRELCSWTLCPMGTRRSARRTTVFGTGSRGRDSRRAVRPSNHRTLRPRPCCESWRVIRATVLAR